MQFHIRFVSDPARMDLRDEFRGEHRQYFDRFADDFIACGETQSDDSQRKLSNIVFADFPDWDDARRFAGSDPYHQRGVYEDVQVLRWRNGLDRRERDFEYREGLIPWYIRGHGKPGMHDTRQGLLAAHLEHFRPYDEGHFIVRGAVWDDSGIEWQGSALLICLESQSALEDFIANEPYHRNGLYDRIEIERYCFRDCACREPETVRPGREVLR